MKKSWCINYLVHLGMLILLQSNLTGLANDTAEYDIWLMTSFSCDVITHKRISFDVEIVEPLISKSILSLPLWRLK